MALGAGSLWAQDRPIGYWRSHLPYNNAIGVVSDGQMLYAISSQSFFSYDAAGGQISTYSKVEGMADVGMARIGYDAATNTVILGYSNANIDLFKDNSFYNIPALKDQSFSGTKSINDIYTLNGRAYLSTSLGVVVLNLESRKVAETYVFSKNNQTIPINAFTGDATYFYAATPRGLYRANRNNPNLQAFSVWTPIDTAHGYISLATVGQKVFVAGTDSLMAVNGNSLQYVLSTGNTTMHIDAGKSVVYLGNFYDTNFYSQVRRIDTNFRVLDSVKRGLIGHIRQTAELADGTFWIADEYPDYGLTRVNSFDGKNQVIPQGPYDRATYDILPYNKDVWIAHGSFGDSYILSNSRSGISHFKNDTWTNYRPGNTQAFENTTDVVSLAKDPADGTIYGGTLQTGIVYLKPEGDRYTAGAIGAGSLEAKVNEPNVFPATSVLFDQGGNLWTTQNLAVNELAVRASDAQWYHYTTPFIGGLAHGATGMILDDYNQKWYFSPFSGGRGVIVYNDNNTPENGNDDSYAQFQKGAGAGNLPGSNVVCLAKDRDGAIWVGTDDGIGIISCGYAATQGQCDAELRVVQYDQFAGYLFAGERVQTIAVDGANRKWVGTANGVWLISPDASKIIQQFNVKNSPLPSNVIQKIAIDPVTGDVYIGTDQGLVSYRYTATEGTSTNSTVVTYPNPVPSGYSGTIAIKGLATDADVRITDISGQLVYRTKALGGQAVWSGQDYTGHRPQSGVYLIFITNKDGSQTAVGKLMFFN